MRDTINSKVILFEIVFVILCSLISGCFQQDGSDGNHTNKTVVYVGLHDADYHTIQEAVDALGNGSTIVIKQGSYNELVTINKTIHLRGEDRNTTLLNFNPDTKITQVPIITLNGENCSIENLTIMLSNHSVIIDGILINSKNNTITHNIITGVTEGIELQIGSRDNAILYNTIQNNLIGINSVNSCNNVIFTNTFSNTQYDLYLSTRSDENNISSNLIANSAFGLRIKGSNLNTIYGNCIQNNDVGMYFCCGAESNIFYNNCLVNNTENGKENAGLVNLWYDSRNQLGNYWDDYIGNDMNKDGVGETYYLIPSANNVDMYPLMSPPLNVSCKS